MSHMLPPSAPLQDCSADLSGPSPTGESTLVVVNYFSRVLEVTVLKSTTSAWIIEAMTPMFARFGVPFFLKTDNGPQFMPEESESFHLQTNGIKHQRSSKVERQNCFLLKCLQIANLEGKNWQIELVT